jgi:hypothetical protein
VAFVYSKGNKQHELFKGAGHDHGHGDHHHH